VQYRQRAGFGPHPVDKGAAISASLIGHFGSSASLIGHFGSSAFRLSTTSLIGHFGSSASLIGHFGSSAFRLSTTTVSMSLAGSRFSSESAPRPLYGAFVVKEFARQQIFCPSSVLCSISKTVSFARPALRPGRRAVKVGRCTSLAACFAFALTASRATARLRGRDNDQRGARYGRGSIAPQPCIR
jgi:hypothetical protein